MTTMISEVQQQAAVLVAASGYDTRRVALAAMADALARACHENSAAEAFPMSLLDLRTTIDSHLLAVASIEASAGSRQSIELLIDRATMAVTRALVPTAS